MAKFIVDLWLDGYDTETEMEAACEEFIYEQLNMTASDVKVDRVPEPPPAPTWTSEVPTEPGWWWIYYDSIDGPCLMEFDKDLLKQWKDGKAMWRAPDPGFAPPPLPAPQAEGGAA